MVCLTSEIEVGQNQVKIPKEIGLFHDISGACIYPFIRYFTCEHSGRVHRFILGCLSRWEDTCPHCAAKWRKTMRRKYHRGVSAMSSPKFITLTLKRSDVVGSDGLKGMHNLDDLWKLRNRLFQIIRKRKNPRTSKPYRIGSWVACIEPPNHIHMIVDCDYIPQHEMVEIWHSITGDSMIVDIRAVRSKSQCSGYVTKYITKTKDWPFLSQTMRSHLRICQSHGIPKDVREKPSFCHCGRLHCLHPTYTSEYFDELKYEEWDRMKLVRSDGT